MTQAEKFEALVRRAKWDVLGDIDEIQFDNAVNGELTTWNGFSIDAGPSLWVNGNKWTCQQVLFNHDFARASFGDELISYSIKGRTPGLSTTVAQCEHSKPADQYHLQQAVILPTPGEQINYMYKAVFGDRI